MIFTWVRQSESCTCRHSDRYMFLDAASGSSDHSCNRLEKACVGSFCKFEHAIISRKKSVAEHVSRDGIVNPLPWLMTLKDIGGTAGLLRHCQVDNLTCIGEVGRAFVSYINQSGEPAIATVLNLREWEAMRITCSCPASQRTLKLQRSHLKSLQGMAISPRVVAPYVPGSLLAGGGGQVRFVEVQRGNT